MNKEKLLWEKRTLEVTLNDEKALKKKLKAFKELLESNKRLEEFDRAVFESIVDKIIIGGNNSDWKINPVMITIIYKTGKKYIYRMVDYSKVDEKILKYGWKNSMLKCVLK